MIIRGLTQGEKDFCTSLLDTHAGNLEHLLHCHVAPAARDCRLCKCAVATGVPTQPCKRREDLQWTLKSQSDSSFMPALFANVPYLKAS